MIKFTKMHSLGNDFIVVDETHPSIEWNEGLIRAWCDRKHGIGADQILKIAQKTEDHFDYHIFNSDGSTAAQCGNGTRCIALWVLRRHPSIKKIVLQTQEGRSMMVEHVRDHFFRTYIDSLRWEECGEGLRIDVGNPHWVFPAKNLHSIDVAGQGPSLSQQMDGGINIEWVEKVDPNQLNLRIYERGVGETLACGSGACAAMIAATHWGWVKDEVRVHMPGGEVSLQWSLDHMGLWMQGPATQVFEGVLD